MTSGSINTAPNRIRNRWAFLVGVNIYRDPYFPKLEFCVDDVQALDRTLSGLGYTVVCMHDKLKHEESRFPDYENVEAELERLAKAVQPDDLLWVHFACHGIRVNQQPHLVMRNTRQITLAKTAIPLTKIEGLMRSSKAKRLVLTLDACYAGVDIGRGSTDANFIENACELAEGFASIAASTAQQVAQEWKKVGHGVFTYFLLEGLKGGADNSGRKFITFNDLQTYVVDCMRRWPFRNRGIIQEPTYRAEGLGDMILADYRQNGRPWTSVIDPMVATNHNPLPRNASARENARQVSSSSSLEDEFRRISVKVKDRGKTNLLKWTIFGGGSVLAIATVVIFGQSIQPKEKPVQPHDSTLPQIPIKPNESFIEEPDSSSSNNPVTPPDENHDSTSAIEPPFQPPEFSDAEEPITPSPSRQESRPSDPPVEPIPDALPSSSYPQLEDLLRNKNWSAANQETSQIILREQGAEEQGYLENSSIENVSCSVLAEIDNLWRRESGGEFGFSVQKRIYNEAGDDFNSFGDYVGWKGNDGEWLSYSDINSSTPAGHFPTGFWFLTEGKIPEEDSWVLNKTFSCF